MGVYHPGNGDGYGRTMPVSSVDILKLLMSDSQRRGFELFHNPFFKPVNPFTGYLFAFDDGPTVGYDPRTGHWLMD